MNFILQPADVAVQVTVATDANGDGSATFQFPAGCDYHIAWHGLASGTLMGSASYQQNGSDIGQTGQNLSPIPPGDLAPALHQRVTGGATLTIQLHDCDASTSLVAAVGARRVGNGNNGKSCSCSR